MGGRQTQRLPACFRSGVHPAGFLSPAPGLTPLAPPPFSVSLGLRPSFSLTTPVRGAAFLLPVQIWAVTEPWGAGVCVRAPAGVCVCTRACMSLHRRRRERCLFLFHAAFTSSWCPLVNNASHSSGNPLWLCTHMCTYTHCMCIPACTYAGTQLPRLHACTLTCAHAFYRRSSSCWESSSHPETVQTHEMCFHTEQSPSYRPLITPNCKLPGGAVRLLFAPYCSI